MTGLVFAAASLALLAGFTAGWVGGYHTGTARGRHLERRRRDSGQFVVFSAVPVGARDVRVISEWDGPVHPVHPTKRKEIA